MEQGFITFLLIVTCSSLFGQYSQIEPKDLTLENYSRQEIRTYLLMMEPEGSEVYQLARQSRKNNTWSIVWYSAGGLFVLGGVSALVEMNRLQNNGLGGFSEGITKAALPFVATLNFSLGGIAIISGISQTNKSRRRLNRAIELYQNE